MTIWWNLDLSTNCRFLRTKRGVQSTGAPPDHHEAAANTAPTARLRGQLHTAQPLGGLWKTGAVSNLFFVLTVWTGTGFQPASSLSGTGNDKLEALEAYPTSTQLLCFWCGSRWRLQ